MTQGLGALEGDGRRRKGEGTRDRAIRAVLERSGSLNARTGLNEVARKTGVSAAGLLHHFGSRDRLVLAAALRAETECVHDGSALLAIRREVVRIAYDSDSHERHAARDHLESITRGAHQGSASELGSVLVSVLDGEPIR